MNFGSNILRLTPGTSRLLSRNLNWNSSSTLCGRVEETNGINTQGYEINAILLILHLFV